MFYHVKDLQFNARVSKPDPRFARILLEAFGGANGELTSAMQYFVQAFISRLFCIFGIVFIALGIPLLDGQNSAWIVLSIVGVMAESIAAMAVYSLMIEKKYKKGRENLQ